MKIINVYNGDFIHSSQGGGMRYLRDLMAAQHRRGYQVVLMAVGTGPPKDIFIEGTPVHYVPVCHTHLWPRFMWGLYRYLRRHGEAYALSMFHLHRVYFSLPVRQVPHAKTVVTIHSRTFAVFAEKYPRLRWLLPVFIDAEGFLIESCVDRLSAAGESAIALYHKRHKIPKEDIVLLRCPGYLPTFAKADPELMKDKRKIILCVGRLAKVKRPLAVLELYRRAAEQVPEFTSRYRLVFAGDGESRHEVVAYMLAYDLQPHVTLLGSVPSEHMPAIYAAGHRLVLLSSSEVAPFSVKEALAAGLPVFATNVGIVRQYVPESCGRVIPPEAPETQIDAFLEFLEHPYSSGGIRNHARRLREKEEALFDAGLRVLYEEAH